MFNVVLHAPEIPPNTGNIIRLCSNTGAKLHIIEPIGFDLNEKSLRRANLDYRLNSEIKIYSDVDSFISKNTDKKMFIVTKFGKSRYDSIAYNYGDYLIFGSESSGIPKESLDKFVLAKTVFLPMFPNNRSVNLANAVSICVYEAWRQNNFLLS